MERTPLFSNKLDGDRYWRGCSRCALVAGTHSRPVECRSAFRHVLIVFCRIFSAWIRWQNNPGISLHKSFNHVAPVHGRVGCGPAVLTETKV